MNNRIKLIIFDLDGVLVHDSVKLHYLALNKALEENVPEFVISEEDHETIYNGLPTKTKLDILISKGLDKNFYDIIWKSKQYYTTKFMEQYESDEKMIVLLSQLKQNGYKLFVASNSIRSTIDLILEKKGLLKYFDYIASNESIKKPKPSPEIYQHCMIECGTTVDETLILEDSYFGRTAALASGCHLLPILIESDVSLENIRNKITEINRSVSIETLVEESFQPMLNVVIPMSGYGSRFSVNGFKLPKPLISINGIPMIQLVINNLGFNNKNTRYIFIVRQEHIDEYCIDYLLNALVSNCIIIPVNKVTEGQLSSVLLAKQYIDNDTPLLTVNSDQYIKDWNSINFIKSVEKLDGSIVTFTNHDNSNKWSYAKTTSNGLVSEVREKQIISKNATVGFYFFKKGSYLVKYGEQMIESGERVNNEFYISPLYNYMINDGKKVGTYEVKEFFGLGVPDDLQYYLDNN